MVTRQKQLSKTRTATANKQHAQHAQEVAQKTTTETTTDQSTVSTQYTTVRQSQEIIQTLVHGAISAFAYSRQLFPLHCFEDHVYDLGDRDCSYKAYAAGNNETPPPATVVPNTTGALAMKVLRRNRSSRVDQFLDWLEVGAFDALKKNYLRALQLSLFVDPEQLSNIVELYSFTFHYSDPKSGSGERTLSAIETTGSGGQRVTIQRAKWALRGFIRDAVLTSGTLGALPDESYVQMHLSYTEDCPTNYHPPGFGSPADDTLFFPDNGYMKTTSSIAGLNAGFHMVSFRVSHLVEETTEEGSHDPDDVPSLPEDLRYRNRGSRLDDIVNEETARQDIVRNTFQPDGPQGRLPKVPFNQPTLRTPLTYRSRQITNMPESASVAILSSNEMEVDSMMQDSFQERCTLPDENTPGVNAPTVSTSSLSPAPESQDLRNRDALRSMLPTSTLLHTQDTQRLPESTQESGHQYKNPIEASTLQISQTTIQELDKRRSILLGPRKIGPSLWTKSDYGVVTTNTIRVKCECGANDEDGRMLNCSFCDTLQHLPCYGYCDLDKSNPPDAHVCYECLLQDTEESLYRELRSLAIFRRSIHIIQREGYENDREFAAKLGCDNTQTAGQIIRNLKKKGYLTSPPSGAKSKNGKRWTICRSKEKMDRMLAELFNPHLKIAHHFELPHSTEAAVLDANARAGNTFQDLAEDAGSQDTLRRSYRVRNTVDYSESRNPHAPAPANATIPSARPAKRKSGTKEPATPFKRLKGSSSSRFLKTGEVTPASRP